MKSSIEQWPRAGVSSLSALILAGGKSSRMGRDKARLTVNGIPMLRRVYDVAVRCTQLVFVVTPWPERYHHLIPDPCQWIVEPSPDELESRSQGPLKGLAHGLTQIKRVSYTTPWVLVLACDLPYLDAEVLTRWAEGLSEMDSNTIAALPRSSTLTGNEYPDQTKRWEPLCGFYRSSCLNSLEAFLARGGQSFQRWLQDEHVEALEMGDRASATMMFNCNTPDDLKLTETNVMSINNLTDLSERRYDSRL